MHKAQCVLIGSLAVHAHSLGPVNLPSMVAHACGGKGRWKE